MLLALQLIHILYLVYHNSLLLLDKHYRISRITELMAQIYRYDLNCRISCFPKEILFKPVYPSRVSSAEIAVLIPVLPQRLIGGKSLTDI